MTESYPQWEGGSSFNYKSEIPETGFGLYISRNLPVQFSSFGIKSRISFDYFFISSENQNDFNADIHADIIAVLFYQNIQPYFGLSIGGSRYYVNEFDEYIFILSSFAGIKLQISEWLHPFIEINSSKYFSDFNETSTGAKISSIQFTGKIGIILKF